jgi:hypothetical protein
MPSTYVTRDFCTCKVVVVVSSGMNACVRIYACLSMCEHVCLSVSEQTCCCLSLSLSLSLSHTHTHISTHTHKSIRARTSAGTHFHAHTCIHTCIHAHTHRASAVWQKRIRRLPLPAQVGYKGSAQ